jgi:hypothetical protein
MVTYKREIKLWRQTNPVQRALMIRDDADPNWMPAGRSCAMGVRIGFLGFNSVLAAARD